ncbi:MAG: LURP-one-related family protein [Solobacterium sp.]|nr:LURP-one-related family protein [Solobacterium sp.]
MKLYMKQKVFYLKDRFTIVNEYGEVCYTAEGEFFTLMKKLHIFDHEGNETAYLRQIFSFMPKYEVIVDNHLIAVVSKKLTLLRPQYEIEGLDWHVDGSWHEHEYEITDNSRVIVSVHKEWMSWGDSYEIDVKDPLDEVNAVAVVLAIDAVLAAQAAAASSGGL